MPEIPGNLPSAAAGLFGALGAPQTEQLGSALAKFQDVLEAAGGQNPAAALEKAMAITDTSLRPADGTVPAPTPIPGQAGQVAALSDTIREAVGNRLEQVQETHDAARDQVKRMLSGEDVDLHNVVLAAERAQLELQLTMQLRNKLLEAYQEVMRMPI